MRHSLMSIDVDIGLFEQETKQRLRGEHSLRGTWERWMMGMQELVEPLVQVGLPRVL